MENTKKLSLEEVADRDAIHQLIDAYAYCADTRDAKGQMTLFTEDTISEQCLERNKARTY